MSNDVGWTRPDGTIMAGGQGGAAHAAPVARSRVGPIEATDAAPGPLQAEALDERALAAAVLAGDRDAFRVLVEREAESVVRACRRVLGDLHEAEDVAQEAFVIAYRSLSSWRGDGPFGAWLSRIAVRLALRQAARRRTVAWRDPYGVSDDDARIRPPLHAENQLDPAILALRAESTASVRAAVASLGEPYRETVALRFFAERSLVEIAAETGRPIGTVKTHLHRGLLKLRDRLLEPGASR